MSTYRILTHINIDGFIYFCTSHDRNGNKQEDVRFEPLKAIAMKNAVFWELMPCRPVQVHEHF